MIRMELKRNKDNFWKTVYVTKLLKSFDGKHVTGIVCKKYIYGFGNIYYILK